MPLHIQFSFRLEAELLLPLARIFDRDGCGAGLKSLALS